MQTPNTEPIPMAVNAVDLADPQRIAMIALLQADTQAEAAAKAGVSERTLRRWMNDSAFVAALRLTRAQLWTEITSCLYASSRRAVQALTDCLDHENPHARIRAARAILEMTARSFDLEDLCGRITEAEREIEARIRNARAAAHPGDASASDSVDEEATAATRGDASDRSTASEKGITPNFRTKADITGHREAQSAVRRLDRWSSERGAGRRSRVEALFGACAAGRGLRARRLSCRLV